MMGTRKQEMGLKMGAGHGTAPAKAAEHPNRKRVAAVAHDAPHQNRSRVATTLDEMDANLLVAVIKDLESSVTKG